jgi:hypothetical protein
MDTSFEAKIVSLLSQRRTAQGLAATVTCEEAEQEVLQEREVSRPGESNSGAVIQPVSETIGFVLQQPAKTRERCRQAARRLAARGEILITKDGKVVDPSFAKGVMEVKLPG